MGLANAVVPKGDGLRVAKAMVREISKSAPGAIRSIKELLLFGIRKYTRENDEPGIITICGSLGIRRS